MPTRNDYAMLVKALQSIKDTASDFSKVEILLRIDDDDKERIDRIPELEAQFNVKTFIGPRGSGYNNMCTFLDDLAKMATGKWSWLFDDDAYIEGDWQKQPVGQSHPATLLRGFRACKNRLAWRLDGQGMAVEQAVSHEALDRFRALLLADGALQDELQAIDDLDAFVVAVLARAQAIQGSDALKRLVAEFDRAWGNKVTRTRDFVEVIQAVGTR